MVSALPDRWLVYLLTNNANGKRYVGITSTTLAVRFSWHCRKAKAGSKLAIHLAIKKYGAAGFKIEELRQVSTLEDAHQAEKDYIISLKSRAGEHGYNLTDGGEGGLGYKHTQASKLKMSAVHKGKKVSTAHKAAVSAKFKGIAKTAEHKAKIAAALAGKAKTEEHRSKISKALLGKPNLAAAGEKHGGAKLTDKQRFEIYGLRQVTKLSMVNIGKLYGVTLSAVQKALKFVDSRLKT